MAFLLPMYRSETYYVLTRIILAAFLYLKDVVTPDFWQMLNIKLR